MAGTLLTACATPGKTTPDKRRYIQDMSRQTLAQLYREAPQARADIARSAGYAVFSNVGNNLLLLSAGSGYGVAYDQRSRRSTYMRMATAGLGLGLGIKDFRSVIVFADGQTFRDFVEQGWDAGVQADAALKAGDKGADAVSVAASARFDKVKVYHLTKNGVALQATVQGYKYWKDGDLN